MILNRLDINPGYIKKANLSRFRRENLLLNEISVSAEDGGSISPVFQSRVRLIVNRRLANIRRIFEITKEMMKGKMILFL